MKRFTGWVMTLVGGSATLWGGVLVLTGSSSTRLVITDDFAPSAMAVGLAGVAVLTLGLVWARD